MGKGTRNRQGRAQEQVTAPAKTVKNQNKSVFYGTIAMGVFAVILVVALLFNALVGTGIFMRSRTAAETDDFKVNGAVMSYFIYTQYTDYVNYWTNYYQQYFGTSISASALIGIDGNVSLKKQIYDEKTGQTWFEYFKDLAVKQVEEILVYCQAAKAAGVELEDEDIESVKSQIQYLDMYASLYGYSLNSYLNTLYGKGVKEKDVRKALELSALASKFAQQIQDGYHDAATLETVEKFFNENKNDYISADYLSYTFKVSLKDLKALEENKDKTEDQVKEIYAEKKTELIAKAEALAALKTKDEFEAHVKELWLAENKDDLHKKYYEEALKTAKGETEEEKKAAATKTADEKVEEDAKDYLETLLREEYAHPGEDNMDKNELAQWIFGKGDVAAATVNSTKQITTDADKDVTDETKKTYSYSITVYFLTRAASRIEDTTRTFSYMLMTGGKEGFTEDQAKAALSLFKQGEITKEKLEELATSEPYKKSSFSTLEEVKEGQTGIDELDEWLYTADRAKGDCELITYTRSSGSGTNVTVTTYYLVVLVDEIGPEEWYIDARQGLVTDQMEKNYEELAKVHAVTINQKAIDKTRI
ncbi:MAG: hypothetical protein E7605_03160 [Ruminococcaceae bacterium]|nr:hypothetical protein [Oscillospiraceae bacterium]